MKIGDVEIQERDKQILRCCYEQQFLTSAHIAQYLFPEGSQEHFRRIARLEKIGLVRREPGVGLRKCSILRVTKEGRRIAQEMSPFDVPQTRSLDIATLEHDSIVTSVRLRLSQLWDGLWMPEKALKDKYAQIPDGIFQFEGSGKIVAVEVENSLKGRTRFVALLKGWRDVPGISLVLYVATSPRIAAAIAGLFPEAPVRPPFGLVEWSSLERGTPKAKSPAGDLDLFSRRRV